jgi:hypothetical protein
VAPVGSGKEASPVIPIREVQFLGERVLGDGSAADCFKVIVGPLIIFVAHL